MRTLQPEKKKRLAVSLGFSLLTNQLAYWLGRLLGQGRSHVNMACTLDAHIPFLTWTVIVYLSFFLFWFLALISFLSSLESSALCAAMYSL